MPEATAREIKGYATQGGAHKMHITEENKVESLKYDFYGSAHKENEATIVYKGEFFTGRPYYVVKDAAECLPAQAGESRLYDIDSTAYTACIPVIIFNLELTSVLYYHHGFPSSRTEGVIKELRDNRDNKLIILSLFEHHIAIDTLLSFGSSAHKHYNIPGHEIRTTADSGGYYNINVGMRVDVNGSVGIEIRSSGLLLKHKTGPVSEFRLNLYPGCLPDFNNAKEMLAFSRYTSMLYTIQDLLLERCKQYGITASNDDKNINCFTQGMNTLCNTDCEEELDPVEQDDELFNKLQILDILAAECLDNTGSTIHGLRKLDTDSLRKWLVSHPRKLSMFEWLSKCLCPAWNGNEPLKGTLFAAGRPSNYRAIEEKDAAEEQKYMPNSR